MVPLLLFASLLGCNDATLSAATVSANGEVEMQVIRRHGSAPVGSSMTAPHTAAKKNKDKPAGEFAKSTSALVRDGYSGEKDQFFADLVTQYSLALWNLTNYSTMVKTRKTAHRNKKLVYKMGVNHENDRKLLHSKVAGLYTVLDSAGSATVKKSCEHGNFSNFQRCLSFALCYIDKGVQLGQVDSRSLQLLATLQAKYLMGAHKTTVLYMKNITNNREFKQESSFLVGYHCNSLFEELSNKSVALVEQGNSATEEGESNVGWEWPWSGRRRRRIFSAILHGIEHAAEDVGHAIVHGAEDIGRAVVHAAEYGARWLKHVAEDGVHFLEHMFDCIGDTSEMLEAGYKWEKVIGPDGNLVGVGVSVEATLGVGIEESMKGVWSKIFEGKSIDLDGLDFTLEASLAVVIGVGVDVEVASADLGVGVEAYISYSHSAGQRTELEIGLKVGVMGAAGALFPGCLFGPTLGPAKCFINDEVTVSIMCCSLDLFTLDADCR